MNANAEKVYQPGSDGPDLQLAFESAGQYGRLWVRERSAGGWDRTGVIEVHPALPTDYSGDCAAGEAIAEWAYTRFHMNGDRVRVGKRLRVTEIDDGVRVVLESEREETLGFGDREEHGWQADRVWMVTPDGVDEQRGEQP